MSRTWFSLPRTARSSRHGREPPRARRPSALNACSRPASVETPLEPADNRCMSPCRRQGATTGSREQASAHATAAGSRGRNSERGSGRAPRAGAADRGSPPCAGKLVQRPCRRHARGRRGSLAPTARREGDPSGGLSQKTRGSLSRIPSLEPWFSRDRFSSELEHVHQVAERRGVGGDIRVLARLRIGKIVATAAGDRRQAPIRLDELRGRNVVGVGVGDVAARRVFRHDDHRDAGAVAEEVERLHVARSRSSRRLHRR